MGSGFPTQNFEILIFLAIALTDFQFLQRLTPLFNAIGDGHSWIRPSRSYINHLFKNSKLLPLGVKIVDDRVFITKNFGNNKAVQKGMEVHAVNGMKTGAILQACAYTSRQTVTTKPGRQTGSATTSPIS